MLAPSQTHLQPFAMSAFAARPSISFCVALGKARSHFTPHGRSPARKRARGKRSAYSLIRPRRTFFSSITQASFSASMPSSSMIEPEESDMEIGFAPNSISFWTVYWATLPEPETRATLPRTPSPRVASISWAKYTEP